MFIFMYVFSLFDPKLHVLVYSHLTHCLWTSTTGHTVLFGCITI